MSRVAGVSDVTKVKVTSPLLELGLDSLMATEIRQVLARRFDLQLSVADVQGLTLEGLRGMMEA